MVTNIILNKLTSINSNLTSFVWRFDVNSNAYFSISKLLIFSNRIQLNELIPRNVVCLIDSNLQLRSHIPCILPVIGCKTNPYTQFQNHKISVTHHLLSIRNKKNIFIEFHYYKYLPHCDVDNRIFDCPYSNRSHISIRNIRSHLSGH